MINSELLLYQERKFKALASQHRIKILNFLKNGEQSLNAIDKHLKPLSEGTIFNHVNKLYNYGVINKRRTKTNTLYSIKDIRVLDSIEIFSEIT